MPQNVEANRRNEYVVTMEAWLASGKSIPATCCTMPMRCAYSIGAPATASKHNVFIGDPRCFENAVHLRRTCPPISTPAGPCRIRA